MSCRLMPSMRSNAEATPARAGAVSAMNIVAAAKPARQPPHRGRERSLSFAVRIVSGITGLPLGCGLSVRHAGRRIAGLYPRGDFEPKESRP